MCFKKRHPFLIFFAVFNFIFAIFGAKTSNFYQIFIFSGRISFLKVHLHLLKKYLCTLVLKYDMCDWALFFAVAIFFLAVFNAFFKRF